MKRLLLVVTSLLFMSCCLDEQMREEIYIDSHFTMPKIKTAEKVYSSPIYYYITNSGEVVRVYVEYNGDVRSEGGEFLFSLQED